MSGNGGSHPGRSVEFLSRLHDGELDAAERARFESHRSHCAECRRAALEFEDALADAASEGCAVSQHEFELAVRFQA